MVGCMGPGCQPSALWGTFPCLALSSLEPPPFTLGWTELALSGEANWGSGGRKRRSKYGGSRRHLPQ